MSWVATIYFFGIFQGTVLLSILLHKYKFNSLTKNLLNGFLGIDVLYLVYQFLVFERYIEQYPHLIGAILPLLFTLPPLFYMYIRFSTIGSPKNQIWPHFIPGVLALMVMLPYYALPSDEKLFMLFNHQHLTTLYPYRDELTAGLLLSGLIYAILSIKISRSVKDSYTNWFANLSSIFFALVLLFGVASVLMKFFVFEHRIIIPVAVILFSALIHFIAYSALLNPMYLFSSGKKPNLMEKTEDFYPQILALLEEEKIYTDPTFNLKQLSHRLSTNDNYLSRIINEKFGCNFPTLVNSFRVEEAKELMASGDFEHLNLLGIATAVGFTNKNSFTRAFKKHTGITPSKYKGSINLKTNTNS